MAASIDGTEPGAFELAPYFPDAGACGPLVERAAALVAEGHRLEAANAPLASALRPLIACMNACHASLLDGQLLRPADVARPPADDSGREPDRRLGAALDRARAHVAAEAALSAALPQRSVGLYAPEFVQCIHAELHRRSVSRAASSDHERPELAAEIPLGANGGRGEVSGYAAGLGRPQQVGHAPGAWRRLPVAAARGAGPEQIPDLLELWQGIYSKPFPRAQAIVAALCAGQRLLAVRPFEQGNGRTARLHTQLVLAAHGVTRGLWSPLGGMARDREGYRKLLRHAVAAAGEREATRRQALGAHVSWLLDVCLHDARAARERLEPKGLERRLLDLLTWLGAHPWVIGSERSVIKPDALEALHYAAITGPVERARFIAMLGLQHRTGRRVLSSLIDCGLLVSDSSRAPVRFNLPWPSLRFLFPDVWPEGPPAPRPSRRATGPRPLR